MNTNLFFSSTLSKWHLVSALLLSATACVGCTGSGEATYAVTGQLKSEGAPLAEAFITFVPDSGRPIRAATDAQGNYNTSLIPGRYRVAILAPSEAEIAEAKNATVAPDRAPPTMGNLSTKSPISEKYADHATSNLSVNVDSTADNRFNFDL